MTVSPEGFRRALARLAGGVTVVTSRDEAGRARGLTATAVCSVSLEPPLVLACLDASTQTHGAVRHSSFFALNVLPRAARDLAVRFGQEGDDKFDDVGHGEGVTGAPLLEAALAYCDCRVERAVPAGDHTVFIGQVESVGVRRRIPAEPLVYYRGRYVGLEPEGEP